MAVLVGKPAPDFTVPAVLADGTIVEDFSFSAATKGKYALVFFYPLDFTFVCPSELIALDHRIPDFKAILGITDGQLGGALLASSMGLLVGLGPTGRLSAKRGSAWVAVPAAIALALSTVIVGTSHSLWQLASTLFIFGFFLGVQDVSMNAHAVAVEHEADRRYMSTFHATFSLGALAGGFTGGTEG